MVCSSLFVHLCFRRYIAPLLLMGRKFDLRVYMVVVWGGEDWLVLMRDGYVRLCCEQYQPSSDDLHVHLTNQYQQKKHPAYTELKDDTVSPQFAATFKTLSFSE